MSDMIGQRFGRLTVVAQAGRIGVNLAYRCVCDCGGERTTRGASLRRGSTTSCGCRIGHATTHGLSETAEYSIYRGIKTRCLNPRWREYAYYGGRGITICDRWLNGDGVRSGAECFVADMGPRPSKKHSVERDDNDGPYSPENCRWATKSEQIANRRFLGRKPRCAS